MKQGKYVQILCLILLFLLAVAAPGWAGGPIDGEVEVIVPAQGLTELDLKTEVYSYRGSSREPVEVHLENPPMRLTAFHVTYDQGKQFLTAEERVKLETEKLVATGPLMTLTPEEVRLPNGGEITALGPEAERLVVKGAFAYQFTDESLRGTGGFLLEGPDWMLEGEDFAGSLRAGEFTADGRLQFRYRDLSGEADSITYHQKEGRLILTGSPLIRWEEGVLQGGADTVISYDLAGGQAKVEGPTKTRFYQDGGVHPSGD
ncbi:MAG: hypothetical protein GX081_06350 [Firmicutes bacterium]|nr:hypothetical protein [Bacillota bacterium]